MAETTIQSSTIKGKISNSNRITGFMSSSGIRLHGLMGCTEGSMALIRGRISNSKKLNGLLSNSGVRLRGSMHYSESSVDPYQGEYTVNPNFVGTTLNTTGKTLMDDVTVNPIQVERTSNPQGGKTIYIGGNING